MSHFTYNVQLPGYAFHIRDDKGDINYEDFVDVFNGFPWGEFMRAREKMADGCSATLSVVDTITNSVLWISVDGDDIRPTFLLGVVFYEPSLIDLGRFLKWDDVRMTDDTQIVLTVCQSFFESRFGQAYSILGSLPMFKSRSSSNQEAEQIVDGKPPKHLYN
jgi:hypothetical protein